MPRKRGAAREDSVVARAAVSAALVLASVATLFAAGSIALGILDKRAERAARRDALPASLDLRVEVLNGEGREGSASEIAAQLREAGFNVLRTGSADHADYRGLIVLARTESARSGARAVGECLGTDLVVLQRQTDPVADVTVIVGAPGRRR